MQSYKYLELPHIERIKEQVLPLIPEFAFKNSYFDGRAKEEFEFPELIEAVSMVRPWSDVAKVAIIAAQPMCHVIEKDTYIHVDVMYNNEKAVGLNFPVYNCEDTYCALYESKYPPYYKDTNYIDGKEFYATHCEKDWVTEIDRYNLKDQAILLNHQIPHGVINATNQSRICISVRFNTLIDIDTFSL